MSLNPTAGEPHPPNPAHPIESLMKTAMEAIAGMIDVNTVVGTPVETGDGTTIIPISRVSFGFAAGGGEYYSPAAAPGRPFGGGSGAGVSVRPVGFLVEHQGSVRLLAVEGGDLATRLMDLAPDVVRWIQERFGRSADGEATPPS
ncbi:MAG: GerW family sporulation protein [Actinomycetia bacterium]|nr:GerW family sporulation protein [Actinomycetes bacterium]